MFSIKDLDAKLREIDGRSYKAYKDIQGSYRYGDTILYIDYVQSDPFAPPSRVRVRVPMSKAGFPPFLYQDRRSIGLEDLLTRYARRSIDSFGKDQPSQKKTVMIDAGQQQVLKRSSCKITPDWVEIRLKVELPAAGRRILGRKAYEILGQSLFSKVEEAVVFNPKREQEMTEWVFLFEDQEKIRQGLQEMGLVAFVANGSILARTSGSSDLPLPVSVPFQSPPGLEVELATLHHGPIKGMGVPKGVTLIVGGGYHGKSTLLKAIEKGAYNHIRGDGREWVISSYNTVKIRAEDGRRIQKVDIRYFIDNLPGGDDTQQFSSLNASGSTSQAANIIEAIETGADLLLMDEDTSATNFMIRDARMQSLVAKEKEPITPFIDRVRSLYEKNEISTILVIGGAGDYLDVADRVVMLDSYRVFDVTTRAQEVAKSISSNRLSDVSEHLLEYRDRIIEKVQPKNSARDRVKISAKGLHTIMVGKEAVDLSGLEQLLDSSQTRTIAECLAHLDRYLDGRPSFKKLIDSIYADLEKDLDRATGFKPGFHPGDLALPRKYELAAAINRLPFLQIE
ncbi:MAG: ABC-ATPase domain-containing protein [Syntrophomonadaceae bacterium]|jgi:predicted ABC-class ATPase|nr:ABC-ATPase domain-containing protein [Syntrophomonadaceae bacterium]